MSFNESDIRRDSIGRFDEKEHSIPEVSLASVTDSFDVPVTVTWTERGVLLTARHRKPRDVDRELEVRPVIPAISSDEAPVGFTTVTTEYTYDDGKERREERTTELRAYDGRLFRAVEDAEGPVSADADSIRARVFRTDWDGAVHVRAGSEDEAHVEAQRMCAEFVSIDGELWRECGEPVYHVQTYGTGGNHGGTSLYLGDSRVELARYAGNGDHAAPSHLFPANQRAEAIAYAQQVARDRGDTESVERMNDVGTVDVGAFEPASSWTPAPRLSYVRPFRAKYGSDYTPAAPAAIERHFADFKAQLMTVPGAVVDAPDGWGGMTKRVDTSKLSREQADDYAEYRALTGY